MSSIKQQAKPKKRIGLKIFGIGLGLTTLTFGYVVADYFYFEPVRNAGKPVYGTRLDHLSPISSSLIQSIQTQGLKQKGVESVQIDIQGASIYLSVQVLDLSVKEAESIAESLAKELTTKAGGAIHDYTLQLIVSSGDTTALIETNRAAEDEHVKQHKLSIVETIVAHTEKYPTATNIQRSNANIEILKKSYPTEATALQQRINQLKEYTAEQEAALEIPTLTVDQTVPSTHLSDFPSWGVYNTQQLEAQWY